MQPIEIFLQDVKKDFPQGNGCLEVLKGISVTFKQGQTYAITGVSGTGKSTLLHIIAGLDIPSSGMIYFNNQNIALFSPHQRSEFFNTCIGLVFQSPYLIKELTVLENIMVMGLIKGDNREKCKKRAQELLVSIGLEDKAEHRPASLSGGQQQRIAILRAIFNKPAFLFADEPTGNLDEYTAQTVVDLLLQCHAQWHMGIIVSSHDTYVAEKMQFTYQLRDGLLHNV